MESLVIHAVSLESAQGFAAALGAFEATLVQDGDGYRVEVSLGGSNRQIVAALSALETHVSERGGPARLNLDGRPYTLHAADSPLPAPGDGEDPAPTPL